MKIDMRIVLYVFALIIIASSLGYAYYYDAHHKRTDDVKVYVLENCKCENSK